MPKILRYFSWGNKKLPKTTAIFNITTALGCPALVKNLCQLVNPLKQCYAMKAERMYKNVLPYRQRQRKFWKQSTANKIVETLMIEKKRKDLQKLRLNEAGDFKHQDDVNKAIEVARILMEDYGVQTYCYTARSDLDFSKRKHLIVNGSDFLVDNCFKVVYKKEDLTGDICGTDCRVCDWCSKRDKKTIKVAAH